MIRPAEGQPPGGAAASPPLGPRLFIALMCFLVAVGGYSVSLYLPSMPSIVVDLDSSPAGVQLTLSVFMIAFGVAQLVWGPLSDRYGRRATLGAGLGLYIAASIGCWAAQSIEALILFRGLQAVGACCAPVVARAVVRDVYERDDMARVMSYVIGAFAVTGIVAPAVGAFIEESVGWRGNFAFMAIAGIVLLATVFAALPETLPAARRQAPGAWRILQNYRILLCDRRHLGYAVAGSLSYTAYFVFSSVAAFVLIGVVGISPLFFAVLYAGVAFGYGVGTTTSARLARRLGLDRTIVAGIAIAAAGSLLHNALAVAGMLDPYAVVLPMVVIAIGLGMVFPNMLAGAIAPFPAFAGAASSTSGFMQMLVSSIIGAVVLQFYDGTQLAMTWGILFSVVAMAGVYYVLVWRRLNATGSR